MTTLPAWVRIAVGLAVFAAGAVIAALGAFGSLGVVVVPAGLVFVFGGALVLLPERYATAQIALGALVASALAAVFGWVAFGGGERRFTGSLAWGDGELVGRAFFALFFVLCASAAIGLWIKYSRVFFGAKVPTDHG